MAGRRNGEEQTLTHEGRTQGLAAWANELGITKAALAYRLRKGGPATAFAPRSRAGRPAKCGGANARETMLEVGGRRQAVSAWAAEAGLSRSTIFERLGRGLPPEQAVKPGRQISDRASDRHLTYQGRTMTLTAWAKELGISVSGLFRRLERGLPEDAVFARGRLPRQPVARKARVYSFGGKTLTEAQWSAELGLRPNGFASRLTRGVTGDRLFTKGHLQQSTPAGIKLLTYGGRTMSITAWARELGISQSAMSCRVRRQLTWSLDEIFMPGAHPTSKGSTRKRKAKPDVSQD